jgi:hypothetical protein
VLLSDEPHGESVADSGVEEIADLFRGHVLGAFLKPAPKKDNNVVFLNESFFLKDVRESLRDGDEQNSPFRHRWDIVRVVTNQTLQLGKQTLDSVPNSSPADTSHSTGNITHRGYGRCMGSCRLSLEGVYSSGQSSWDFRYNRSQTKQHRPDCSQLLVGGQHQCNPSQPDANANDQLSACT